MNITKRGFYLFGAWCFAAGAGLVLLVAPLRNILITTPDCQCAAAEPETGAWIGSVPHELKASAPRANATHCPGRTAAAARINL